MGGGGGTYFSGPTDIDRLEDIARREIREKKASKTSQEGVSKF